MSVIATYYFSYNPKYQEITVSKHGHKSITARVKANENYTLKHENIFEFEVNNQRFFEIKDLVVQTTPSVPHFQVCDDGNSYAFVHKYGLEWGNEVITLDILRS